MEFFIGTFDAQGTQDLFLVTIPLSAGLIPVQIVYTVIDGLDLVHHAKMSFVAYAVLAWPFVIGHLLVFLGLFVFCGRKGSSVLDVDEFRDQFKGSRRFGSERRSHRSLSSSPMGHCGGGIRSGLMTAGKNVEIRFKMTTG